MTEAKPQNYWISPTALHITLNALSDADYMQASVSSGAMIMCYMKGIEGLEYDHGHNYKRWPLRISRTYFTTVTKKYVYVRIPRPTADPAEVVTDVAQVVFASEYVDLYGMTEDGRQVGDASFYYIYTQGIISASEPTADGLRRHWEQDIVTGTLASDEAYDDDGDGTWWRWNAVTDTVEFLKTIASATFEYLKAAQAEIHNLSVTGIFDAVRGYIDDLRSHNYQSGMLNGSGFRLTNDNGDGASELEVDLLKVRKKATFMELEIREETFVGGNQHYSPAGSIIYRVEYMDMDDQVLGYSVMKVPFLLRKFAFLGRMFNYAARKRIRLKLSDEEWRRVHHFRCYLLADDGTTATRNWWKVGDQPRCQTFNKAVSAQNKRDNGYNWKKDHFNDDPSTPMPTYTTIEGPFETSYYWRLVTNVGSEKLEDDRAYDFVDMPYEGWDVTIGGVRHHYTDDEKRSFRDAGSGIPVAGDTIVCMGNRTDQERMNMISLYTSGNDNNPPAIKGYRGIHTFNIKPENKVFEISPNEFLIRSRMFKLLDDSDYQFPVPLDRGEWQQGVRYHWYDRVSWKGSIWLCQVTDDYLWEDADGNNYEESSVTDIEYGEGEFEYATGKTDHYYRTGRVNGTQVYYIRYYTTSEPDRNNELWLREVSKGTEIVSSEIHYAASLDGVNHPDDEDTGGIDPSTVVVPDAMKSQTTALLSSFAQALAPTAVPVAGSATHEYLSKLYYEARSQYYDGTSPYGLPLLFRKELFPSLTEYYGSESNPDGAFSALAGVLFAMVLCEIRPDRHNAVWKAGYNLGGDKTTFIYKYRFESDQNIARMVGSVLWAAMRGIIQPDTKTMQRELGGSDLGITIREVSDRPFADYKDTYYIDLTQFMPTAPGPYLTGYTDRSSIGGVPYDAYDLADHNLQQDLDIYNLVVSDYNLGGSHHQEVVQAIADKEMAMAHLFGRNRSQDGYSFHPVFGTDTIGKEISDSGATASFVSDIASIGRGLRHPLQLGVYYGRRRPGQSETDGVSKSGAAGVLMNMTIDNIDGSPSGYGREGDYNTHEASSVYANSYPSGHSSGIWAVALMLIEAMPQNAALIMKAANTYAMNRQITRYHWNSDTILGRVAGATIAPMMRASSDWSVLFAAAKAELAQGSGSAWKTTIEETGIVDGMYLWTRTTFYYEDPNNPGREPTREYSVARWGEDGAGIKLTLNRNGAYTDAQWDLWGTIGRSESYGHRSDDPDFTVCRVDDIFVVTGSSSDSGRQHIAQYKCTGVSASSVTGVCISHIADGTNGTNGEAGHVGRWYYYAGDWNPSTEYKFENTKAPYVKCDNDYYMLDCAAWPDTQQSSATYIAQGSNTDPRSHGSGNPWSPMTAVFKYIITEALFTNNAKLGSFIFNNDWMISTNGSPSGKTYYDFDPNGFKNYITSGTSYSGFIPNFAVDGKTGKTYQNDAYVKGTINATSGSITGNMSVGDAGTNRLEIAGNRKNGSIVESYIDGYNKSGNRILRLGFTTYSSGNASDAYLNLKNLSGKNQTYVYPSNINIENTVGFVTSVLTVGWLNDKIRISAPLSCWPTRNQVSVGEVFLGDDEILRVRRS